MTPLASNDYKSLFESAPGLYLVLLPDLTITAVSDAYLKATLTARESIVGHGLFEIFPDNPNDIAADGVLNLRASLNYVLQHKLPHTMAAQKYDIRRLDGTFEVRYWSPLNTPVLTAQNEVVYIIHNVTDVTTRQISEEKLKKSEKDYQLLVNSVKDYAIFMVDPNGCVASWNSGAELIKGYTAKEIIGKPIDIFYTAEDRKKGKPKNNLQMALKQGHYETDDWRLRKDGSLFYANIVLTSLVDDAGTLYGYAKVTKDISGSKKTETALKESEEQVQTIFKNAPDAVVVIDEEGRIVKWNPRAETIFGWKANEVTGKHLDETIIPQQFREKHIKGMQHFLKTGEGPVLNKHIELPALRKDNTIFDAGISISPTIVKGKYVFIGFISDITERKRAEEALSKLNEELEQRVIERTAEIGKREKHFRALIENNHDIISLLDDKFKVFYRSPSAERIMGWSDEDIINSEGTENVHPDEKEKAASVVRELMANPGKTINTLHRIKHKNGHYLWMEGTVINLLHDQDIKAIVFNYRDVTERKGLENLLHKANLLARIGGWEIDMIKGTVYWTDITREIHETEYGYVPDLATGINFYKEGNGRDLIIQKVNEAIELGKPWDVELQIITAKNNERWIRTIGEAEFVNGKCVRVYGSFQDIDQRKKAQLEVQELNEQLEQKVISRTEQLKRSVEDLESFSYSVSHDLRAPLRIILGYASILNEDYGSQLSEEAKHVTEVIKNNTAKMGQLIDDLLNFSRLARQDILKTRINTNKVVQEIIESLEPDVRAKVIWVVHPLPVSMADLNMIRQVWINFISNAIKYSSKTSQPRIEIGSFNHNGQTAFYIKDNGVGFDEKYVHKLFKVFQRLHKSDEFEGTGVGLAIVDKIIGKHGGKVWAEAKVDEGASFFFTLPQ